MSTCLLFPGGTPESLAQLNALKTQGSAVIGASSIINDPARTLYSSWKFLPFVADPAFEESILTLIKNENITSIFTRHPIIGRYLKRLVAAHNLSITLDAEEFAAQSITQQRLLFKQVDDALHIPFNLNLNNEAPTLTRLEMAAMMQHVLRIDGQSSDEKIVALMEIFRSCPKGDIIEIGSFWGRSACLLTLLNHHYAIGHLLCIDPWENLSAHQEGVPEHVNDEARDIDFESAFNGFLLNLLPYSQGRVNYIRSDSHRAHAQYRPNHTVTSEAFGSTTYAGTIACLHIDGNHDLAHITADIDDWVPHMAAGGWIIIDDYQWTFGDGPQKAADAWMSSNASRITRAFVTGSALFIKIAN